MGQGAAARPAAPFCFGTLPFTPPAPGSSLLGGSPLGSLLARWLPPCGIFGRHARDLEATAGESGPRASPERPPHPRDQRRNGMLSARRRSPQRNRASARLEMILRAWSRRDPVSTRGQEPVLCLKRLQSRCLAGSRARFCRRLAFVCVRVRVRVELRGHGRASASSDFASNRAGSARGAAPG